MAQLQRSEFVEILTSIHAYTHTRTRASAASTACSIRISFFGLLGLYHIRSGDTNTRIQNNWPCCALSCIYVWSHVNVVVVVVASVVSIFSTVFIWALCGIFECFYLDSVYWVHLHMYVDGKCVCARVWMVYFVICCFLLLLFFDSNANATAKSLSNCIGPICELRVVNVEILLHNWTFPYHMGFHFFFLAQRLATANQLRFFIRHSFCLLS